MAKQATKQDKTTQKPLSVGEKIEQWLDAVAETQRNGSEVVDAVEQAFNLFPQLAEKVKKNKTRALVLVEKGLTPAFNEVMAQNRELDNKRADTSEDLRTVCLCDIEKVEASLTELQAEGQIWAGRSKQRFEDASDFRTMVIRTNTGFSFLAGKLQFLKLKIAKLGPPAEPDPGPVKCPRCGTDAVELVRADMSEKVYQCSTVACKEFSIPLNIPSPEPAAAE